MGIGRAANRMATSKYISQNDADLKSNYFFTILSERPTCRRFDIVCEECIAPFRGSSGVRDLLFVRDLPFCIVSLL